MNEKELNPVIIEGSIGGNQDWFRDYWMKLGGCAAVTACDSSIYFAQEFKMTELYPFNITELSKKDYIEFSKIMKPYLKPRFSGIDRLGIYIDGYERYLKDVGNNSIKVTGLEGTCEYEKYEHAVIQQLDNNLPIPCLVLKHKLPHLDDYVWHWFLLMGYGYQGNKLMVKTVTYSHERWFFLEDIWNSGYKRKGGLILFK